MWIFYFKPKYFQNKGTGLEYLEGVYASPVSFFKCTLVYIHTVCMYVQYFNIFILVL